MPLTKREAAIISAYTGYLIGNFSDMHAYAEEKFGEPIFSSAFANQKIADKLRKLSKQDFISIPVENGN